MWLRKEYSILLFWQRVLIFFRWFEFTADKNFRHETCCSYVLSYNSLLPIQGLKSNLHHKLRISWEKQLLTQSIEKNFLIDPLIRNNAIYRNSLILIISLHSCTFYFCLKHAEHNAMQFLFLSQTCRI